MSATILLGLLLASPPLPAVASAEIDRIEEKQVAFEALADGDLQRAVAELEARLRSDPSDPALLINLGAAYARLGQPDLAALAFQSAIESDTRYDLELEDGRWLDSRKAAQMAMASLSSGMALAQR